MRFAEFDNKFKKSSNIRRSRMRQCEILDSKTANVKVGEQKFGNNIGMTTNYRHDLKRVDDFLRASISARVTKGNDEGN